MELKTSDLAKALKIANIVIERRNTIPILSYVKLDAIDEIAGSACFTGTNLDQQIRVVAPLISGQTRAACLPTPLALAKLISAGAGNTTSLDVSEGKAALKAGELAGEIGTLPADDFPVVAHTFNTAWEAELGEDAINMIFRVAGAVSAEETRYYLNGIFIYHVEGWTYRVLATDGHRLYRGTIELPGAFGKHFEGKGRDAGIIIPRYAINHLAKIRSFASRNAPLKLAVGTRGDNGAPSLIESAGSAPIVRFGMDCHGFPVELLSTTIDGTFPDYARVIPNYGEDTPQVVFRREDLRRALDGITAGMTERSRAVKLTFDPKGALIVSAKWIDTGFDGKIAIEAKTRTARGPFEVGFNGGYLRSLLDTGRGEELVMTTQDAAAPGTIVDPTADDFLAVLMPMRV